MTSIVIYDPKTGLNSPIFWTVFRDLDPKFGLNILNLNTTSKLGYFKDLRHVHGPNTVVIKTPLFLFFNKA